MNTNIDQINVDNWDLAQELYTNSDKEERNKEAVKNSKYARENSKE